MTNLKLGKLSCTVLARVICAQASRQLQIELGPNQQVSILASGVGYGEVKF